MRKLIQALVVVGILGAGVCSGLGAAAEPMGSLCSPVLSGLPAVGAPDPGQEPLFAATGVWCCLGEEPLLYCQESTPEICAAAGVPSFALLGICWRLTGGCGWPQG